MRNVKILSRMKETKEMIWTERKLLHKHLQMLTEEKKLYDWDDSSVAFSKVFMASIGYSAMFLFVGWLLVHFFKDLLKLLKCFSRRK